jgi:hypothetical protein
VPGQRLRSPGPRGLGRSRSKIWLASLPIGTGRRRHVAVMTTCHRAARPEQKIPPGIGRRPRPVAETETGLAGAEPALAQARPPAAPEPGTRSVCTSMVEASRAVASPGRICLPGKREATSSSARRNATFSELCLKSPWRRRLEPPSPRPGRPPLPSAVLVTNHGPLGSGTRSRSMLAKSRRTDWGARRRPTPAGKGARSPLTPPQPA